MANDAWPVSATPVDETPAIPASALFHAKVAPGLSDAGRRALADLVRREILVQALWPPVVALTLAMLAGLALWPSWQDWLALPALPAWLQPLSLFGAALSLTLAVLALAYLLTLALLALFALPAMMTRVARRHYPALARRATAAQALRASLANSLQVTALFIVGGLISLPLLLVPGANLLLSLAWMSWLNARTFAFDALVEHATPEERAALLEGERGLWRRAGLLGALAALLPVVGWLLAPAFTALLYVHLLLPRLAALRAASREPYSTV